MEIIKKYRFLSIILIALFISGFTPMGKKYGNLEIVPKGHNQLTIQDLIDKWDDYNIYYSDNYSRIQRTITSGHRVRSEK